MDEKNPPLLVIVGPTAVGKTALSIQIAKAFSGEIVSADSRQIYRFMDIGTAKPTGEELQSAPHHLVDFLTPDKTITVSEYQRMAYQTIDEILNRQSLPILIGGTGQYIKAVVEGWSIPEVPPHESIRADLLGFADAYGSTTLHNWLSHVDDGAGRSIDFRNIRRVVRALEVYIVTGKPITELQKRQPPHYSVLIIGLTRERDELYARVDQRIEHMLDDGLISEIDDLISRGYGWDLPSMSSLGYRQFSQYFSGEVDIASCVQEVKRETRRYIRQQYNWFRLEDSSILWFDVGKVNNEQIITEIGKRLTRLGFAHLDNNLSR